MKSLIFWFFALVILGTGHFAFATDTVNWGTLGEVVVTAPRPQKKESLSQNSNAIPKGNDIVKQNEGSKKEECKGVKLNTNLPFLWNCIGVTSDTKNPNQLNAFPIMIKGLMKIVISIVLVVSFLMIVAGGVMMASWGYDASNFSKGKGMIKSVAQALAMLGASGVILKLINPNFFN